MDKLAAMRAFVEIADRGSLTAAARALDRSLPTMVRVLAVLEEALGARLLQRTTRRIALTDEGRDYLERCRRILADVEDAEHAVARSQGEPQGLLRVTAPVLFGQMHVAPAITGFVHRFPKVKVDLQLLDRLVNLVDEGVDLAVRIGPLADSTMVAIPIGSMRRVVCASPGLLRSTGVPQHPTELGSLPCVGFTGITRGETWTFHESGRGLSVNVNGSFRCNQAAATAAACADGLGFGMFLAYQINPLLEAGELELVLEAFEHPALPVSLIYPQTRIVSSRLRAMLDWLKVELRQD